MNTTTNHQLRLFRRLLIITALGLALLTTDALAGNGKGKGKPGGGGGGGGDTGTQPYTILNLGPGRAVAVNDLGEAIGGTNDDRAAYWSVDANDNVTQQLLPNFNLDCWADDLNNFGQAVGVIGNGVDATSRAVVWSNLGTPGVSAQYLGEPSVPAGIVPYTFARAINSNGFVVGTVQYRDEEGNLSSYGKEAVVWQPNGSGYDIFELPGPLSANAWDINDHGEIVGRVMADPVVWQLQFDGDGLISGIAGPIVLTSLGGPPAARSESTTTA